MMKLYSFLLVLASFSLIMGCGGSSSTGNSGTQTFNGTGSTWEVTFDEDNSTFSASEVDSGAVVSGTFDDLATGFRQLTFTATSGNTAPAVGTTAWGISIPGVALMTTPILSDETKPVAFVRNGECPASQSYNWIDAQVADDRDSSNASRDFFGRFTWVADSGVTVNTGYNLTSFANQQAGSEEYAGSCTNGVITVGGGNDGGTIYMTASGPGMITTTDGGNLIYGIPAQSISLTDLGGKNYSGMIFQASGSTEADRFFPATLVMNAAGTSGTATVKDGVGADASDSGTATLTLSTANNPSDGLVTGSITVGSNSGNMGWAVLADVGGTGKTAIFGIGQDPDDNTKGYIMMFISTSSTASNQLGLTNIFMASFNWLKGLLGM